MRELTDAAMYSYDTEGALVGTSDGQSDVIRTVFDLMLTLYNSSALRHSDQLPFGNENQ